MNSMMNFENNYRQQIHAFDLINGKCEEWRFRVGDWSFTFSLLEAGQIDQAEKEKARIEQAQRSRTATSLCAKWFKQDGDTYIPIGDDESHANYWKKRQEHWSGVEFLQLW